MHLVLDDLGPYRRDLGDLMTQGHGVGAVKCGPTPGTARGLAGDGLVKPIGRDQRSDGPSVPGLSAPLLDRGRPGGLAFEMDRVSGRGLRGVVRVGVELGLERMDLGLQGVDLEPHCLDESPDLDWQGVPDGLWQRCG
jgi:hypothetical protein